MALQIKCTKCMYESYDNEYVYTIQLTSDYIIIWIDYVTDFWSNSIVSIKGFSKKVYEQNPIKNSSCDLKKLKGWKELEKVFDTFNINYNEYFW